ncbi:MAG: hypothetical protein PHI98_15975 [Eubacteriales bacterium]|nr:hypothetical protein [Eubacteriales bacterium]
MSLWQRIKQGFRSFMSGRYGADKLGMALLWSGLGFYLVGSIIGSIQGAAVLPFMGSLFTLVGFAAYVYAIYRMFSRNVDKRREENRRYENKLTRTKTKRKQAMMRHKNRKQYKYFKCPNCHSWLRLPRGTGVVTVTCSKCHNSFTQKG